MKRLIKKQVLIPVLALAVLVGASSFKSDFFEIAKQIEIDRAIQFQKDKLLSDSMYDLDQLITRRKQGTQPCFDEIEIARHIYKLLESNYKE